MIKTICILGTVGILLLAPHDKDTYVSYESMALMADPCPDLTGNPTIDGHKCETGGEWTNIGLDFANDQPTATADVIGLWTARRGDSLCFAWERQANGAGTSSFNLIFDSDCDPNTDEFLIEFVWGAIGAAGSSPITVTVRDGVPPTPDPTGSGFQGMSVCGDPSTAGQYAEFCVSLQSIIDAGFIDPCCGVITL
ncbi:MAG: hypothetical protein OEQ53_12980, partial [Saprospiraceae bacterium]|nr:hypothetical protein [Saprospiraceae bacterium]